MSTPEEEFPGSRSSHPKYVFTYTSHEHANQFAEGVARRRFWAIVDDRDPKVEVSYDRSRGFGWVHPLSGTKEMWMAPGPPRATCYVTTGRSLNSATKTPAEELGWGSGMPSLLSIGPDISPASPPLHRTQFSIA
jgi:hypothetical protein